MQNLALSSQFSNSGRRGSSSSNTFQSLVMNGVLPPSDDGRVEGLAATPPPRGYTADGKPFFGGELDEPFNPGADIDWGFGGSSTGWTPPDIVNPFDPNNRNNNNNNNNNPPDIADRRNNSGNPHNPNNPESPAGDNFGKGDDNNNDNQNNIVSGQAYYTIDENGNRIWVLPGQGYWILDHNGLPWIWFPKPKKPGLKEKVNDKRKDYIGPTRGIELDKHYEFWLGDDDSFMGGDPSALDIILEKFAFFLLFGFTARLTDYKVNKAWSEIEDYVEVIFEKAKWDGKDVPDKRPNGNGKLNYT